MVVVVAVIVVDGAEFKVAGTVFEDAFISATGRGGAGTEKRDFGGEKTAFFSWGGVVAGWGTEFAVETLAAVTAAKKEGCNTEDEKEEEEAGDAAGGGVAEEGVVPVVVGRVGFDVRGGGGVGGR